MRVLSGAPDPRLDRIVRLAALTLRAPRATITLLDDETIWVRSAYGVEDLVSWPKAGTVSDLTVALGEPIFSGDIRADPRYAARLGETTTDVRYCAFAPLKTRTGEAIGVLGVSDVEPRPARPTARPCSTSPPSPSTSCCARPTPGVSVAWSTA